MKNNNRINIPLIKERANVVLLAVVGLMMGALLLSTFMLAVDSPIFCTLTASSTLFGAETNNKAFADAKIQVETILHYATSRVVPQQTKAEIRVSLDLLQSISPCNFLVFGLGHDSQMWNSFNQGGTTLFLEEDPKWIQTILRDAPFLHAHSVNYRTRLSEAENLLESYHSQPDCIDKLFLQGNERCRLALHQLPQEVYNKEWDAIMIDAPRGYFGEAPGRMAAIYSAAVMGRNRKRPPGVTHVFLHDVDRKVEKAYAEEFLCRKYMVKAQGRLWHFEIPSSVANKVANKTLSNSAAVFC